MNLTNQTQVTYFIIRGISDAPNIQVAIFSLILLMYLVTLGGNITIVLAVCTESQLHTPMYFFLCNLSILDISFSTLTLHKLLISFISGDNTVSVTACMAQMYIFTSLVCDELWILTAMSYDRYVAICKPLHYSTIMKFDICSIVATACWMLGFLESLPNIVLISKFTCYKSKEINHFFCDVVPLIKLSCNDTSLADFCIFFSGLFMSTFPFLLTFISYVFIIHAIFRIRSKAGKHKAFYTCSSHLTVVFLLYLTLGCQYLRPVSSETLDSNKRFSLFNTAVVPMLNPIIYSLKNEDVKAVVRQSWCLKAK
ncbi:olfactory receptor 5AR1-like [Gastrophryne carolinensis]